MARRFRVIQYDGPEDWIIRTIDKSLPAWFPVGNAEIVTWEASEGDRITARDFKPHSDERFSEIDAQIVPPFNGRRPSEVCAWDETAAMKNGKCQVCLAEIG